MKIPTRTIVPALIMALAASTAHAGAKATPAPIESPASTASTPLDLTLPSTTLASPTPELSMPAATEALPTPVDPMAAGSIEMQRVVRWIRNSHDNRNMPYLLVDKVNAQVFVFDATSHFLGTAPALLGMGTGDRLLVPNSAPMSAMPPQKRITPAGRYLSRLAIDSHGKELLVIDYDASISLHPVIPGTPEERRAERLASATAQDNRISFGCINVPIPFYEGVVSPAFTRKMGVVYILPETSAANDLFGFVPFDAPATAQTPVATGAVATPAAPASGAR